MKDQSGNSLLELMMYIPVFMLFCFIVVDGGFAFREHAALARAVRSGTNMEHDCSKRFPVLGVSNSQLSVDNVAAQNLADCLADQIYSQVSGILIERDSTFGAFKVDVGIYQLNIDPDLGDVTSRFKLISSNRSRGHGDAEYAKSYASGRFKTEDVFLEQRVGAEANAMSIYAIHSGHMLDGFNARQKYLDTSIVAYVEVAAVTSGVNPHATSILMSNLFTLQSQDLIALRTQLF